jgi:hypothetical protein
MENRLFQTPLVGYLGHELNKLNFEIIIGGHCDNWEAIVHKAKKFT